MFDTFGNKVRIKSSSETLQMGIAERIGKICGRSVPSLSKVEVVGVATEDFAFGVEVEGIDDILWFPPDLLEMLDNGAGTEIVLDGIGKKWVKNENGVWIKIGPEIQPEANRHKWWKFWEK